MSWLVSSIANTLRLDDDDDDFDPKTTNSAAASAASSTTTTAEKDDDENRQINSRQMDSSSSSPPDQPAPRRSVKEDLSELSQTLTRQLWGVASFLAPPPQISDRDRQSDDSDANPGDPAGISGIRSDLSEIGGKFRTGISKLSSNKAVSEFTKIASNFLQFGVEDLTVEDYAKRGVVGITEEVVAFARDVALHPETWLDFPLPDVEDDEEDFDLSDAQQEHALAVEHLVPELAALRSEICLGYMSEAAFWKIYFVLVHPRLSKHDALILSTPEIVKARAMLSQELRNCGNSMPYESRGTNASVDPTPLSHEEHLSVPMIDESESVPVEISAVEPASSVATDLEMDKHPVTCTEIPVVDKTIIEEVSTKRTNVEEVSTKQTNNEGVSAKQKNNEDVSTEQTNIAEVSTKQANTEAVSSNQTNVQKPTAYTSKIADQKDEDDADDWFKEEHTEAGSFKGNSYPLENDEDITFSDLEEDD